VNTLAEIHVGTSSFTAAGWEGPFYPKEIPVKTPRIAPAWRVVLTYRVPQAALASAVREYVAAPRAD